MNTKAYGDKRLVTRVVLAKQLCMHPRTIDRWVAEGRLQAIYHPLGKARGRRVYFDAAAATKAMKLPG